MQRYLIAIGMLALISPVLPGLVAAETTAEGSTAAPAVGDVTRDWLVLQREGEQASPIERTLPGPIQDRIYQRYLQSFEYPIPENFYSRDTFREGQ